MQVDGVLGFGKTERMRCIDDVDPSSLHFFLAVETPEVWSLIFGTGEAGGGEYCLAKESRMLASPRHTKD